MRVELFSIYNRHHSPSPSSSSLPLSLSPSLPLFLSPSLPLSPPLSRSPSLSLPPFFGHIQPFRALGLEDDADFETADENEDDDKPRISQEPPASEMNAIMEPVKDDEDELPWQAIVLTLHISFKHRIEFWLVCRAYCIRFTLFRRLSSELVLLSILLYSLGMSWLFYISICAGLLCGSCRRGDCSIGSQRDSGLALQLSSL